MRSDRYKATFKQAKLFFFIERLTYLLLGKFQCRYSLIQRFCALGNLFFQILTTPGLYERLREDRTLVADAVEESLRHTSPVAIALRRVVGNAEVGGIPLADGAVLVLGLASANHVDGLRGAAGLPGRIAICVPRQAMAITSSGRRFRRLGAILFPSVSAI